MDTRAQGGTWAAGDTADAGAGSSGPEHPGVMSRGIASPETYYYRRLYVDAVRAVETAAGLSGVDADRIAVAGTSQGGALALAAAALAPESIRLCHADIPFLCDIERGMDIALDPPYTELVRFLAVHPELEATARRTLSYVDNAVLASRIRAKTLVSVGLRDPITPPSTVFAAYNAIDRAKRDRGLSLRRARGADRACRAAAGRVRARARLTDALPPEHCAGRHVEEVHATRVDRELELRSRRDGLLTVDACGEERAVVVGEQALADAASSSAARTASATTRGASIAKMTCDSAPRSSTTVARTRSRGRLGSACASLWKSVGRIPRITRRSASRTSSGSGSS